MPVSKQTLLVKLFVEIFVKTWLSRCKPSFRRNIAFKIFGGLQIPVLAVSLSSKREEVRHRTQMGELEDQFREHERKLVEQSVDLRQRLDGLQSKLVTLQFDRDPATPVSKLQEQVTCKQTFRQRVVSPTDSSQTSDVDVNLICQLQYISIKCTRFQIKCYYNIEWKQGLFFVSRSLLQKVTTFYIAKVLVGETDGTSQALKYCMLFTVTSN